MPNIYHSGDELPESRGAVKGGLAVVMHDPSEVDGLIAVCALAPRPPEDPMISLYRVLNDSSLDLNVWATHWHDQELLHLGNTYDQRSSQPNSDAKSLIDSNRADEWVPKGHIARLAVGLNLAKELWLAQEEEISELSLLVLVAEPNSTIASEVHLDGEGAALVIKPGSLIGDVVRAPLHATTWAICVMLGGGSSTSARRLGMIERLRVKAQKPGVADIPDIRQIRQPLTTDKPLAVLVHGLFSTDVGTFQALQTRLSAIFTVLGFPHDTLSETIDANGRDLAQRLASLRPPDVTLIAHSRGGLVARSAALHLRNANSNVRVGRCATFGTPHLGAEMAESPGSLIATLALLKAGLADRSVAGLADMLCCYGELRSFPGISDLRPASTHDSWLTKFQKEEGLFADSSMEMIVVGGEKSPTSLKERLANSIIRRVIGRQASDFVVAQSSSLPTLGDPKSRSEKTDCDHFHYFREDQSNVLNKVVTFLSDSVAAAEEERRSKRTAEIEGKLREARGQRKSIIVKPTAATNENS